MYQVCTKISFSVIFFPNQSGIFLKEVFRIPTRPRTLSIKIIWYGLSVKDFICSILKPLTIVQIMSYVPFKFQLLFKKGARLWSFH